MQKKLNNGLRKKINFNIPIEVIKKIFANFALVSEIRLSSQNS
ncbi:hypothetical protein HMPREF1199_01602 [Hoylesella oralis CC98A]|nr:hypothetical protein HMPREF1199_01602 [Hoylesella oralis CC98A]